MKLLSDINDKGTTVIMATHNADIVKSLSKRVVELEKGRMVHDGKHKTHEAKNGHEEKEAHKTHDAHEEKEEKE